MRITRHKKTRFWAVTDEDNILVCVCVYRKGAVNLVRRVRRLQRDTLIPVVDPASLLCSCCLDTRRKRPL